MSTEKYPCPLSQVDLILHTLVTLLNSSIICISPKELSSQLNKFRKCKRRRQCMPEIVAMVMSHAAFDLQDYNAQAFLQILEMQRQKINNSPTSNHRQRLVIDAMIFYFANRNLGHTPKEIFERWIRSQIFPIQQLSYNEKKKLVCTVKWLEQLRFITDVQRKSWLCDIFGLDDYQELMDQLKNQQKAAKILKTMYDLIEKQSLSAEQAFETSFVMLMSKSRQNLKTFFLYKFFGKYLTALGEQLQKQQSSWIYFQDSTKIKSNIQRVFFLFVIPRFLGQASIQNQQFSGSLQEYYRVYFPLVLKQMLNQTTGFQLRQLFAKKYELIMQSINCFYKHQYFNPTAENLMQIYGIDEGMAHRIFIIDSNMWNNTTGNRMS